MAFGFRLTDGRPWNKQVISGLVFGFSWCLMLPSVSTGIVGLVAMLSGVLHSVGIVGWFNALACIAASLLGMFVFVMILMLAVSWSHRRY